MLIIVVKEKEKIDRPLKRYKNKVDKTKLVKQVRKRLQHKKKSQRRREEILKAIYRERFKIKQEQHSYST